MFINPILKALFRRTTNFAIQLNSHIFRHLYYEPKQTLSACAVRQRRRKTGAADFALTTFQKESRLSTCRPCSLLEGREVIP